MASQVAPATERAGPADDPVAAAFVHAQDAAATLAAWTPADRASALVALRRQAGAAAGEIAATVADETGKATVDALVTELLPAQLHLRWLARHAPRVLAEHRVSPWPQLTTRAAVRSVPRGVAGVITPWNYPFFLTLLPTATALAAGCAVVVKPSPVTVDSARWLPRLARRAGLPDGAVMVVTGDARAGRRVVDLADVVAFTGSTRVGREVAAQAARRLVPTILELGGNDAMVVLPGADLRQAARTAVWGAFLTAGQSCVAVERVFVDARVHGAFLAELDRAMGDVSPQGAPRRDIGPLSLPGQAATVRAHLDDAVARGARVRHGGRWSRDAHGRARLDPTVLTDVPLDAEVLRQETFGPLLPVVAVADADDAVARVNAAAHGLSASVWGPRRRARAVAKELAVGAVGINDAMGHLGMPALPFGGRGDSGLGRLGGAAGLRAFSHQVAVAETRLTLPREPQWFPRLFGPRLAQAVVRTLGR